MRELGNRVLTVRNLHVTYGGRRTRVHAVRGVSLDLQPREKLGIVGESGCGKSTLARALMRLLPPSAQMSADLMKLHGQDMMGMSERELCKVRGTRIALIFQDPMSSLDPVKPIGNQIVEALREHDHSSTKRQLINDAIELLKEVEVPHAARRIDDYPHQYSGGMRQRVMIAIALASSPDLVIADEPTTALDVTTEAQVLDTLDRVVSDRGTAVILITHNLGIVSEFCDRVHVMYAGRIVERGALADVFGHSLHPYSRALLGAIPRADQERGELYSIPGFPPDLSTPIEGCPFEARCPLGHNVPLCRDVEPPEMEVSEGASAECHFAGQTQLPPPQVNKR